jgi:hypothetical protein
MTLLVLRTWRCAASRVLAGALAGVLAATSLGAQQPVAPIASPRDTARGVIGPVHLLIDYGRPSKRGRVIFGGLVPFDSVWRTGANAATTLVLDHAVVIGGTPVAAGTYTLYSIPSATNPWRLVINRQTGQWGTEYHAEQDLARIPLITTTVSPGVEQFTIRVVPAGSGATLQLVWDTTVASAPITVP